MTDRARLHRNICRWALAASLLGAACRTSVEDVHRWANTQQGPRKIVAVMTHDKYPDELRIEAAMTLVRMKPRSGRRVGIDELVSGLAQLPPLARTRLVAGMIPQLEAELRRPPPPEPAAGAPREVDTTFPYKDAAFALLTHQGEELVSGARERQALRAALSDWAMADFSGRMDDASQAYGMGQVMAELGAEGVRRLSRLIVPEAKKIGSVAALIAELGDEATKVEASRRLVEVAREVDSPAWLARKAPLLKRANEASGLQVDGPRFEAQLAQYQEEELLRVFASLKQIGRAPAADYLIGYAQDESHGPKRREAALAALEGHIDRNDPELVSRLLALASADATPDALREQALRRVGELPRKQVIDALYGLFSHSSWKVRWVAAEIVLQMSEVSHLDEFMQKLGRVREMAITEAIRYGKLIAGLRGSPQVRDVIGAYAAAGKPAPVRLAALGYYLDQGKTDQLAALEPFARDATRVPSCPKNADGCEWQCELAIDGERVVKPVQTLADFVQYCVKPAIMARATPPPAAIETARN